jgi:gliding motility-associated lipoprotein GldH
MAQLPLKIFFTAFALSLFGCENSEGLKEITDFKNNEWKAEQVQKFKLVVKDLDKPYTFKYLVRNAVGYPYFNIYLKQQLKDPSGMVIKSSSDEILLFDPKTGKPKGDGLGDIFDHKVVAPALKRVVFTVPGTYVWEVTHNMRPNPLPGIMSIGAEIIKVE